MITFEKAKATLEKNGQPQLLRFYDRLSDAEKAALLAQIEALDFGEISDMQRQLSSAGESGASTAGQVLTPPEVAELSGEALSNAAAVGEEAIRQGQVGVIIVAGGQGSRLGYDGPKGCYPVGPISNNSLFYFHARKILALEQFYGTQVPFYVMTSPMNRAATEDFFIGNDYFGLAKDRVIFFSQAVWPALDADGKIVLDAPSHIFTSPDGHGGMLSALKRSGCFDDMAKRGVTTLFYFQVDNPLVDIAAPAFIGYHIMKKADISLKLCAKRDANEGLGMVVLKDGKPAMVEYSELTDAQKNERRADGRLKLLYGSVAIHVFSADFLRREADAGLPLHIAHKKVPVCDDNGDTVKPAEPNAFKFEKFIFDVMPDAGTCVSVAFDRAEEFSPVKNATGSDSPETCRRDLSTKWARWLHQCGVAVPLDADGYAVHKIEIDPCYALSPEALRDRLAAGDFAVDKDGDIYLARGDGHDTMVEQRELADADRVARAKDARAYPADYHFSLVAEMHEDTMDQVIAALRPFNVIKKPEEGAMSSASKYRSVRFSVRLASREEMEALDKAVKAVHGAKVLL